MAAENTVTISIEKYFELLKQSEMNDYLLGELKRYDERFRRYDDILFRLEDEVRRMRNGK